MLMLGNEPRSSAHSNLYYNEVRFRPIFQSAYLAAEHPRSRRKKESKLDLFVDVKPRSRHSTSKEIEDDEINTDNRNKFTEDNSLYAKIEDEDEDDDDDEISETEKPLSKEKNNKKDKHKQSNKEKHEVDEKYKSTIEHLCSKLRVSFVLAILGAIILLVCCCTLFLRNRIVACCKKCWPFRKKKKKNKTSKKDLFDIEGGDYPYERPGKSSFLKSNKKKKNPPKMIDTGVQDSRTSVLKSPEEEPVTVGCSPCCKKKNKKKNKKQRRK